SRRHPVARPAPSLAPPLLGAHPGSSTGYCGRVFPNRGSGSAMIRFLEISNYTLFYYYLASNLIYVFLLITAVARNAIHQRRLASIRIDHIKDSPFTPPITILVPAHNEEGTIVEAIESLLSLDYPELELVIINDGSKDRTLD